MKLLQISMITLTLLGSSFAVAESQGAYLGAKVGAYGLDTGVGDIKEPAIGVYGGYQFNDYFSLEAEVSYLSEATIRNVDVKAALGVISLRPSYPVSEQWEVFAKLGWGWLNVEATSGFVSRSAEDDGEMFGLGALWRNESYHVRLELQSDGDLAEFGVLTVGVAKEF